MIMGDDNFSPGAEKSKDLSGFLQGVTNFREDDASKVGTFGRIQASEYG